MPLHQERPCHFSTVTCHLEHAPFRFSRNSTCHRSSASDVLATRKPYTHIHALHPSYATRPHTHTHSRVSTRERNTPRRSMCWHCSPRTLGPSFSRVQVFYPLALVLPVHCSSPRRTPLAPSFTIVSPAQRRMRVARSLFSTLSSLPFSFFFRFTFSALRGCISCVECTGRPSA